MKHALPEEYSHFIDEYIALMNRLRRDTRLSPEEILDLDRKKYNTHRELEKIAKACGYGKNDVLMHILQAENNLAEYDLPEIALFDADSTQAVIDFFAPESSTFLHANNRIKVDSNGRKTPVSDTFMRDSVFLLFGLDTSTHVFDHEQFFFRTPLGEERKRRIQSLVEKTQLGDHVEIELIEKFHQGVNVYGYVISKRHLPVVARYIQTHRKEFSPAKEHIDQESTLSEWERIIQEDIESILSYIPGENESYYSIIETYKSDRLVFLYESEMPVELQTEIRRTINRQCREAIETLENKELEAKLESEERQWELYTPRNRHK